MLKKASRLTSIEVRAILKDGRSLRLGALSAKFRPGKARKAAVVVKSSVVKNAVARNRLRRIAYAALMSALPEKVEMVLFVHKPSFSLEELTSLCSKLS